MLAGMFNRKPEAVRDPMNWEGASSKRISPTCFIDILISIDCGIGNPPEKCIVGDILRFQRRPGPSQCMRIDRSILYLSLRGVARQSFTARIGRAQFYRARSASTKYGLTAPLLSESRTLQFTPAYPT